MSAKTVFQRYVQEIWTKKDIAAIDELIAPNFIGRIAGAPDIVGIEGYKCFFLAQTRAFPDSQNVVEETVEEGERIAARWTFRGTHQGELNGLAPTGKSVTSTLTVIYRFRGGKIVEIRGDANRLGMLRQLGVLPTPVD